MGLFRSKMNQHSAVLSGHLHDLWFDVDALALQRGGECVTIDLCRKIRGPVVGVLTVSGAERVDIADTQQVGWYDINRIEISDDRRIVTIIGNIPITVRWSGPNPIVVEFVGVDGD